MEHVPTPSRLDKKKCVKTTKQNSYKLIHLGLMIGCVCMEHICPLLWLLLLGVVI